MTRSDIAVLQRSRLAKVLVILIFARYWLYWEAAFCIPVGNYLVSVFDILISAGVIYTLLKWGVCSKWLASFSFFLCITLGVSTMLAIFGGAEYRGLDLFISTWYVCIPYLLFAVIPLNMTTFLSWVTRLTLGWFSAQMLLGAFGVTTVIGRALHINQLIVLDVYAGISRPNNTLGGATAGAATALFLLATFLDLHGVRKRSDLWLVLATLAGVVVSFARSTWVLAGFVVVPWFFQSMRKRSSSVMIMITVVTLIITLLSPPILRSIEARFSKESTAASDMYRFQEVRNAYSALVSGNDWLFGTGWGTACLRSWVPVSTMPLLPRGWNPHSIDLSQYRFHAVHNTYLVVLNELGIVGSAVAALGFLLMVLPRIRKYNVSFYVMLGALFSHLITETCVLHPESGYAFALMLWTGSTIRAMQPVRCSNQSGKSSPVSGEQVE